MHVARPSYELAFSLLCLGSAFFVYGTLSRADTLTVTIFHIGKGVAVLVENPTGNTILIDTGPDARVLRALGTTLPEWQRSIGLVVLSTLSASASGAAPLLLSRYHVGNLLRNHSTGSPSFESALTEALSREPSTTLLYAEKGERLRLGNKEFLEVLWPPQTKEALHEPDGALALLLTYGDAAILFEESLTPRMATALDTQVAALELPAPPLRISSSTPTGIYTILPTGVVGTSTIK